MSLLRKILAIKQVRTPLEFGINENVRLVAIDNEVRKWEGEIIKRNTFLTFAKFDAKDIKIASSEFSYFNLDHTSDFVLDNLVSQLGHLNALVGILNPGIEIDPTTSYEDLDEVKAALRTKKGCEHFMTVMWEQFLEAVTDKIGNESPLLRMKVVTDSKGRWVQLPRESHFVEAVDSDCTLSITPYELKIRNKGLEATVEKADEKGDSPMDKPKKKSALAGL
jgi:hypothetical protein